MFWGMNIVFLSGMPRAGSTLLANLLAQNPAFHCTSTNDLLDVMCLVRDRWMQLSGFQAQGLKAVEPRIRNLLRGMIAGFYIEEFAAEKTVFDKSRGHLSKIELLEMILGEPIKLVVPVRDIRDVVASFEKIWRKSVLTDHPLAGADVFRCLTLQGRAERLCDLTGTIGYPVAALQDVYDRGLADRLVIVPYHELTHDPVGTVARICYECGLEPFTCDPWHVEQVTVENDTVYGMPDLHRVRPVVEPDAGNSWVGILDPAFADFLVSRYPLVQQLANRRYLGSRDGTARSKVVSSDSEGQTWNQ